MKDKLFQLHNKIKEWNCKCCSGPKYIDNGCLYCQTQDKELENLTADFLKTLRWCTIDEDILFYLNSVKNTNKVKEITDILDRYNYDTFLNTKLNKINENLGNNHIESEDCNYLIYFIKNKYYEDSNILYIINLLMKKLICKEIQMSEDLKLDFIKLFTETMMINIHPNVKKAKCEFTELDKETMGSSAYNTIDLDKVTIVNLLNKNDYIHLLMIIFHECTHTFQHYQLSNENSIGFISYSNLLNSKEEIIRENIDGYYKENYHLFSKEVEARYMQIMLTLQFLEANQLTLKPDDRIFLIEDMKKEEELINNQTRKVDGKITTVDELFDSLNLEYDIIKRYPALDFEYKNVDNKLVRKTKEELLADYNSYKNSELYQGQNQIVIDYLYNKLLEKVQIQERGSYGN